MYTLRSIAKRGSALGGAVALLVATIIPSASVFADALNPLTDRSLTLSSGSPGWAYTDGSGNATYAPPNSGANGQKTGNTFSFKVSTDTSSGSDKVKAMTFQYCTSSAGNCMGPGDIPYDTSGGAGNYTRATNAASAASQKSDLEIVAPSAAEIDTGDFGSIISSSTGNPLTMPNRDSSEGSFVVFHDNGGTWVQDDGWTMTVDDNQGPSGAGTVGAGTSTGKNNFITLSNSTGAGFASGTEVKVIFFGTDANYITNPGSGAFFVKINTYKDETTLTEANLIDGGVTVANVMNQSIQISTKVLETMDFSVGTVDPYTLSSTGGAGSQFGVATGGQTQHGQCDRILQGMTPTDPKNTLSMGDEDAENSLRTDKTYSTHSYWRLSSNSSAGATVYYSGVTLKNTVGDEIQAIGTTPAAPIRGTPQFGLALANGSIADNPQPLTSNPGSIHAVDYGKERDTNKVYENGADNAVAGVHATVATDIAAQSLAGYHSPRLYPLIPAAAYDQGAGVVNGGADYGAGGTGPATTEFAFDPNANQIPAVLATQDQQVVDCVTAKVRYIANIAATTPAGIYTTKINYIAAPQY